MTSLERTSPGPTVLRPQPAMGRLPMPSPSFLVELALVAVVIAVSVLARSVVERAGETPYQEFLRMQWLLVDGGKGLHLDSLSLPLAPLLHVATAMAVGPDLAERWLPVALSVAIALVFARWLLRDYPPAVKLVAAGLLIASPLFYLLQRQLDVQVYLLLLGLQLLALRAFRVQPTVTRITAVIGVNILLSLTTYMALPALIAATIYLVVLAERQREVQPAAWRALLWLYIPFSFAGYLLWAVFWVVAGSRVETSFFIPASSGDPSQLSQMLRSLGGDLALPLLLLFGLVAGLLLVPRATTAGATHRRDHALAWAVLTCAGFALGLIGLQTVARRLPMQIDVITFTMLLLIPAALASVFGRPAAPFRSMSWVTRAVLVASAAVVVVLFPLRYVVDPDSLEGRLPAADARQRAERDAAAAFAGADPGGRILLDPRFTATFVREAGIDPRRLITPFDDGFEQIVKAPPDDVRVLLVTDSLSDDVAGNYTAGRLTELMPDATLIAHGEAGSAKVRAFRRELYKEPAQDLPFVERDPAVSQQENTVLMAVLSEMQSRNGLPVRPDGWAYAIDLGNLMSYAARRGNIELFRMFSDRVVNDYLVTQSDDANALYTVAWRHRPDKQNEASGTTETLRMAEAYWTAGERWDNEYYRRLAYLMTRAYARHQWSDEYGEGWFIRNYYNYETKSYATNTFLVDYAPDVMRRIAQYMEDPSLLAAADKATVFVAAAQLDSGLFHEMYQPEIATLYANITFFSPNGIIQLIDSIEAALGLAEISAPERARRTFEFAREHYRPFTALSNQYHMDGRATGERENAPAVYAYIIRLGVRLDGRDPWLTELVTQKLNADRMFGGERTVQDDFNWFFAWTSALLALREYQEVPPS